MQRDTPQEEARRRAKAAAAVAALGSDDSDAELEGPPVRTATASDCTASCRNVSERGVCASVTHARVRICRLVQMDMAQLFKRIHLADGLDEDGNALSDSGGEYED